MTATLTTPLKTHGGKYYLARRIVTFMPRHLHYVEPFCGGCSVLLARDPDDPALAAGDTSQDRGVSEVINDLDGRLTNFFRVVRDPDAFPRFHRIVSSMPLSRPEWEAARDHAHDGADPVADAAAFFVTCRMSRSGLRKTFTPLTRARTRRGMNGNASEWLGAVDGLAEVLARLRRVVMESLPALELIRREDGPRTLFYCDPPYLHETRSTTTEHGSFEMSEADHRELLGVLLAARGKVMLSGYPSRLYDEALAGWTRHAFDLANHAAGGKRKGRETEVLWCNF
jgi:DNA adenine methylase